MKKEITLLVNSKRFRTFLKYALTDFEFSSKTEELTFSLENNILAFGTLQYAVEGKGEGTFEVDIEKLMKLLKILKNVPEQPMRVVINEYGIVLNFQL